VLPRLMLLFVLMAGWIARDAAAATLDGVTLPDSYMVNGQSLVLNGIGVRTLTIFRVKVYVAALYVAKPSHDSAQILASPEPKVIVLQFIHSGSKAQVQREYREGEANNCGNGECAPTDQTDFERLVASAPAVNPGDKSAYVFTDKGVKVFANSEMIDDFANPDLGYHLLASFIGQHPPSEALRNGLLGLPPD
jgi:hypothetical protein